MNPKWLALPAGFLALAVTAYLTQAQTPPGQPPVSAVAGVYNSVAKTCTDGAPCYLQTDINGNLATSGGGGGGGAVTIADGADVTQGAKADSAWVSGSGSVVALLKNIAGGIAGSIPAGSAQIGRVSNDPCAYSTKVNFPVSFQTTTLTQQVAASGTDKIYICSLSLIASAATVFSISGGTGSNCASNQLGILGVAGTATHGLSLAANGGLTLGNGGSTVGVTAASSALCLVQSGAGDISGNITYVYAP